MFAHLNPYSSYFGDICGLYSPFLHQLTMQSSLFEPGRLRPCPSYSRRRDRINLGLLRSLYKGGAQKHSEAGYRRPVDRGVWTAKTVKRPRQQPAHPQYANYWAPLTHKRRTMPHSAQPQHTNHWAPRTRKRHQQEHRPQRPTERSDPTQHAKGRTGDCSGPRKGATTRRNVTRGVHVWVVDNYPHMPQ